MNEGLEKFKELLRTDEAFRIRLQEATQAYTGEQTEEAIFNNVLVPFASEYGITCTLDELNEYLSGLQNNDELSADEIEQIAGGDKDAWNTYGAGMTLCVYAGVGLGGSGGDGVGVGCIVVGVSNSVGSGLSDCMGLGLSGNSK